jgi:hypothetical protein
MQNVRLRRQRQQAPVGPHNSGTFRRAAGSCNAGRATTRKPASPLEEAPMHGIIYIVGLIVVIMFILSFLGLR